MNKEYKEVKLQKRVKLFVFGLSACVWVLVLIGRQWEACIIPLMFSVAAFFLVRNDRIIYNDQEVILMISPFSKKIFLSWEEIKNVEVKYQSKLQRGGIKYDWYLIITYTLNGVRTETLEKLYYNYDGAGDFEDTYKRINDL